MWSAEKRAFDSRSQEKLIDRLVVLPNSRLILGKISAPTSGGSPGCILSNEMDETVKKAA